MGCLDPRHALGWTALTIVCLLALQPEPAHAQASPAGLWQTPARQPEARDSPGAPRKGRTVHLDHATLRPLLDGAPREFTTAARTSPAEIELPLPEDGFQSFRFVESPVMAPELAARYPDIRTFSGTAVGDASTIVRFNVTPAGLHAYIRSPSGTSCIDPLRGDDATLHMVYAKADADENDGFQCLTPAAGAALRSAAQAAAASSGTSLRIYRLACAATGEFTQLHGGTLKAGVAAVVTVVNRLNAIYEPEVAIRFVLVANNDQIIYANSATDPYTGTDASALLGENQANLDAVIGDANYDIGHVLSGASGGLATLNSVCVSGLKARAQTGRGSSTTDTFYVDYVAHEIGHQFGARHTFNSTTGGCGGGNRDSTTAYEPGSGSTIMSYGGNCGSDNIASKSDLYFHAASLDQIIGYSTAGDGSACPTVIATGNHTPTVSAGPVYSIPKSTPFILTATGSDLDGDALTYCWEEMDLGPAAALTAPDNGSSPLFRSYKPGANPWRMFPALASILAGTSAGEKLPTATRTLNFRVTARDNRTAGGGVNGADTQVSVISTAGPFLVTSHTNGGNFSNTTTVTWNVGGTASSPISVSQVNIWLSTNNGTTYPVPLAAATANDGSEVVTLPNISTTLARLKVEAVGNIFFTIASSNFTIVPVPPVPVVGLSGTALTAESCTPANGAIDPGEIVTVIFTLRNNSNVKTTNLVATLQAAGGVTSPSGSQTYGALNPAGTATKSFSFAASGVCGGSLTATLQLTDNALGLGAVSKTFSLGSVKTNTFSRTNSASISIPGSGTQGPAALYPSTVAFSGITGTVVSVRVTLAGLTHGYAGDVDALLVGPTGQTAMLISDAGNGTNIAGATLTFDSSASTSLVPEGWIVTSTNKPTDYDSASDGFPSPAPSGPYDQTLSSFNGLDPNGTWSLYLFDDAALDSGSLTQGWRMTISTTTLQCCGAAANTAPSIGSVADRIVHAGTLILITNTATDAEAPPQTLSFAFATNGPPAATLNATSGVFRWPTTDADANTTNLIRIRVTDDGVPPLAHSNVFKLTVLPRPLIQSVTVTNSATRLAWTSIAGQSYRVQQRTNLTDTNWASWTPDIIAAGPLATATNAAGSGPGRFYRVWVLP